MACSEIRIREMKVFARHGVYETEKQEGQFFYLNATLFQDIAEAGRTDNLNLSTDYGEVCLYMESWMKENTFQLIETVAERLSEALLIRFPLIEAVELEIRKPFAPVSVEFESISVMQKKGWHTVYLSLGSNMGDSRNFLEQALQKLNSFPHTKVIKTSDMIVTKPYGGVEQRDFLNAAVQIKTFLDPHSLLDFLHEMEREAGRERIIHWGPRTLDLDILFYDDLILGDETLVIPHDDLENREFVLKPMCEIAPYFRHPVLRKTMRQLLSALKNTD